MNKYIISLGLLILLFSSCSSSKQLTNKQSATIDWSKYNTFSFNEIKADSCPGVIAPSTIQVVEKGIVREMDKNGIDFRMKGELFINLTFRFSNPNFVNDAEMKAYVLSQKYQTKSYQKLMNYYKDGIVMMTVIDPTSGEELFMSVAKGFINNDGSEIARGKALQGDVANALFVGFPKTNKISITQQKKNEAKQKYKEERKKMNESYKEAAKAEREAEKKARMEAKKAREAKKTGTKKSDAEQSTELK